MKGKSILEWGPTLHGQTEAMLLGRLGDDAVFGIGRTLAELATGSGLLFRDRNLHQNTWACNKSCCDKASCAVQYYEALALKVCWKSLQQKLCDAVQTEALIQFQKVLCRSHRWASLSMDCNPKMGAVF